MPSVAFKLWSTVRSARLDAVERAHAAIRETGPGRHEAARQINFAYTLLLAAEFQGFCRELHTEAITAITKTLPAATAMIVSEEFTWNRQLDRGNPSPSSLGSDFGRLGLLLWPECDQRTHTGPQLRAKLERMLAWRNAIAHDDYEPSRLGGTIKLKLGQVRRWRRVCHRLARLLDRVTFEHLQETTGQPPW